MIEAGSPAPEFTLAQIDGRVETLEQLRAGGSVLLVFYKVSCPTCKLTLPYLNQVKIRTVGISQDSAESTAKFSRQFGVTIPSGLDLDRDGYRVSNSYGIHHVPALFVVSEQGLVLERIEGFDKDALDRLGVEFGSEENVPEFKPG